MRIVFVLATAGMEGGVRTVATYGRLLKARGHTVTVISLPQPIPSVKDRVKSLVKGKGWLPTPARDPSHLDMVDIEHRELDVYRPVVDADVPDADVVIATWWETVPWVAALSPQKGVKLHYVQDHETWGSPPLDKLEAAYRAPLGKIVISTFLRDLLRERYGQEAIALVGNAVDADQFDAPPRGKQTRPTMGMVYSSKANKGTDLALAAYQIALQKIPDLKLVIMSNEPLLERMPIPPDAAFTMKARDHVVRDLYASCDAWVFSTRWEGFGLPVLEAMACRTPVVAAPAGAAPEILAQGGGRLVAAESPPALAEAVVEICRLPDPEWRILSEKARANATSRTWARATDQFEATLQKASGKS